ncbi:MAG: hypothetical protein MZV64_19235 [Ignavibacteriales bacterium]|nr:hypothetical protein [Ignavibacteriales bacterium]
MTQTHTHSHLRAAAGQSTKRLSISLFITLALTVLIEAAAGIFSNSLALLTGAAHNLTGRHCAPD